MGNLEAKTIKHRPLVSILMPVYNHERWLAHAIESVMMQKTNFDYELIISEDCSTDQSREIAIKYYEQYPDRIRLLLNEKNLGMRANGRQVTEAAIGKYTASLEGDDYWTDPHKLQKQVDFLESHPEYSGCYHSVSIVDENDEPLDIGQTPYIFSEDKDYTKEDWISCFLPGQSGSVVMRNLYKSASRDVLDVCYGAQCADDNVKPILLLHYGKIRQMGTTMSCYRRTYTGDSWNARARRTDMRSFHYIASLERERLATMLLKFDFFPHYYAIDTLQNVLEEHFTSHTKTSKEILRQMVTYDFAQFVACLAIADIHRLQQSRASFFFEAEEIEAMGSTSKNHYILFGTGDYGERGHGFLSAIHADIAEVWDNDEKKTIFHGLPVCRPHSNCTERIVLATEKYIDEMGRQLKELGYKKQAFVALHKLIKEIYLPLLSRKYPEIFFMAKGILDKGRTVEFIMNT